MQSPSGQDWLQTPHSQAWQSTPAVTIEQFCDTLEVINEYNIIPELPLLPAFQVINQFKCLPDFLMFPTFLVLQHQGHSTCACPQRRPSLDMEIIEPVESTSSSYIFPRPLSFESHDTRSFTTRRGDHKCYESLELQELIDFDQLVKLSSMHARHN